MNRNLMVYPEPVKRLNQAGLGSRSLAFSACRLYEAIRKSEKKNTAKNRKRCNKNTNFCACISILSPLMKKHVLDVTCYVLDVT